MPKLNLESVTAADIEGKSFKKLPAGGYVVKVVDVMPEPDKERVWFVFDIAEGDYMGYYSDAYGIEHPNAHRMLMSYKQTALGMLKGRLQMIDACNPGFDAAAAFEADKWTLFHGRLFGLVVGEEEYIANNGDTRTRVDWFHAKWKSVESIRNEDYFVPELKTLDGSAPMPKQPERTANIYSDDIPFD